MIKVTDYPQTSVTVTQAAPGTTDSYVNIPTPSTFALIPGASSSATVEYTVDNSLNNWQSWAKGTVTAYTEDTLTANVVAVRLKVITGSATLCITGGRNG